MRQSLLLFVSKDFLFRCRLFVVCCCFDSMQISSSRCHFPPHPFPCGAGPAGTDDQLQRSSDPRMVSLLLRSVSHWQDGQRGPGRQSCKKHVCDFGWQKFIQLISTSLWLHYFLDLFGLNMVCIYYPYLQAFCNSSGWPLHPSSPPQQRSHLRWLNLPRLRQRRERIDWFLRVYPGDECQPVKQCGGEAAHGLLPLWQGQVGGDQREGDGRGDWDPLLCGGAQRGERWKL